MLDERDGMLERLGERIGAVILKTPETVRLWLLVSVSLKRSVIAKFMGMLERDIDERVDEGETPRGDRCPERGRVSGGGVELK